MSKPQPATKGAMQRSKAACEIQIFSVFPKYSVITFLGDEKHPPLQATS